MFLQACACNMTVNSLHTAYTSMRCASCRRSTGAVQLTAFQQLLSTYSYYLQKIGQVNPDVHLKLFRVIHLIDPLSAMFTPHLLFRAFVFWIGSMLGVAKARH